MKVKIREQSIALQGEQPDADKLARLCWDVWRLGNFYTQALNTLSSPASHAPYIPPEVSGERTERLAAMDAKLEEVLGDLVDAEEDAADNADDFAFQSSADELVTLVQYGAIIEEYADLIEEIRGVEFIDGNGEQRSVQNLVMESFGGFDALLHALLKIAIISLATR
jgi:hypothetical protein